MIDNTNADTVATEIAAHFKQDTFKILKAVIKHPEAFGVEFEDEYREIENTIKKEVENIWKELQLQDKQQQIDNVKAVTKVTK